MSFQALTQGILFVTSFHAIELCVALDNILNNSQRKGAKEIIYEFSMIDNNSLQLSIKDIGKPLSESIKDCDLIFKKGVTTTKGSGLGLSNVKRIFKDNMNGDVVCNTKYKKGFELLIRFNKA